jgi:hypothetical protein
VGRYDLPDPKCNHKRKGIVTAGSADGAHAATSCCDRSECIADAIEWAEATARLPARFIPDKPKHEQAALL